MGSSRGRHSSSIRRRRYRDGRRRLPVSEPVGRVVVVAVAVRGSNLVVYCVVLALYEEV